MDKYIPRLTDNVLKEYLEAFGAVLITGPKWCGKTTTAKQQAKSIINFQDQENKESYKQIAALNPYALLVGDNPSQIDEAANNLLKLKEKVDVRQKPSFLAIITATKYGYKREDGVYVIPIGCLKP